MAATHLPHNEGRTALLEAALEDLASGGPGRVQPNAICARLGLSKALVNYHFGNRDGLVLEAMALGYERYVDHLADAADAAGTSARDQLFAWIRAQITWTRENAGLAAALDFPAVFADTATASDSGELGEAHRRMHEAGTRNFATLTRLVAAAREELATGETDPVESAFDAAIIGWSVLGASVWNSGQHLPTQDLGVAEHVPMAQEYLLDVIERHLSR